MCLGNSLHDLNISKLQVSNIFLASLFSFLQFPQKIGMDFTGYTLHEMSILNFFLRERKREASPKSCMLQHLLILPSFCKKLDNINKPKKQVCIFYAEFQENLSIHPQRLLLWQHTYNINNCVRTVCFFFLMKCKSQT